MHYHYNPQEPGDSLQAYCADHVPEDERWMTYLCDCEHHNQCVVCEEMEEPLQLCAVCGGESEHNWEVHVAELYAG